LKTHGLIWSATTGARRGMLACGLILFLQNCSPVQTDNPLRAEASELVREVCLTWGKTMPTWTDGDAENTINSIDYAYRVQEATCLPITGNVQ